MLANMQVNCGKHSWLSFDLQSMICRPADLIVIMPAGASIGVLAKIESADSVMHLEEILDAVDGAMVARGDLGAELPVEQVRLLFASVLHGSPVVLQWHVSAARPLHTQVLLVIELSVLHANCQPWDTICAAMAPTPGQ